MPRIKTETINPLDYDMDIRSRRVRIRNLELGLVPSLTVLDWEVLFKD